MWDPTLGLSWMGWSAMAQALQVVDAVEPLLAPDPPVRAQLQDGGDPVGAGALGTNRHQQGDRAEEGVLEGATGSVDGGAPVVRQLVDEALAEAAGRGGCVGEIGDLGSTARGDPGQ